MEKADGGKFLQIKKSTWNAAPIWNRSGIHCREIMQQVFRGEGSYSCHSILAAECGLTIFLTCSREEQRRRLQVREGDHYPVFENRWIPMEENYFSHYSIETGSHFVVDTSNF